MKIVLVFFALFVSLIVLAKPLDSLRIETIKGQKFIIHKVDKTDDITKLIKRYKTTLSDINKHNEIKQKKIVKNQTLRIPYSSELAKLNTPIKNDTSKIDEAHANAQAVEVQKVYTHIVVNGDNINSIAKKYKVTAAQLTKWNNLKTNKVLLGQIIIVDESATVKPYQRLNGPEAQLPQNIQRPKFGKGDLIEQTGIAFIDETMQVLHSEAPIGTIIKVINLDNNKQCLVRVSGLLDASKYKNFVISIGKEAQDKLQLNSVTARVKISYMLVP